VVGNFNKKEDDDAENVLQLKFQHKWGFYQGVKSYNGQSKVWQRPFEITRY